MESKTKMEKITKEEAKAKYAALWRLFLDTKDKETRMKIGIRMDYYQPFICGGPGKEWNEFTVTLSGFNEYWGNI